MVRSGEGRGDERRDVRFSESGKPRKQKIIVFEEGVSPQSYYDVLASCRGHIVRRLPLINGVAVLVDDDEATDVQALMSTRSGIRRMDDDITIEKADQSTGRTEWMPRILQQVPWGMLRIRALNSGRTGRGVKVAVLDTGIESRHPDLIGNVKGGYNAVTTSNSHEDDNGHGTHVAGTIGALANSFGVVGVAPNASMYSVKVLDSRGSGSLSYLIDGLGWCIESGIKIVNLSLSSTRDNPTFREAIQKARQAGITMVCAAGNSGPAANTVGYPAKYPETIAVAASSENDTIAEFSSRGPEVDVTAPGVGVLSTWLRRNYKKSSGTSMAAPHVAGLVALMYEASAALSPTEVKSIIQSTAAQIGEAPQSSQGAGLVDVRRALERVSKRPGERSFESPTIPGGRSVAR